VDKNSLGVVVGAEKREMKIVEGGKMKKSMPPKKGLKGSNPERQVEKESHLGIKYIAGSGGIQLQNKIQG